MYPALANSPQTELSAAITDVETTLSVVNAGLLPAAPNLATIGNDETAETILYTGISGNDLTGVTRGFQSTAKSWSIGAQVSRNFTAYDHDTFKGNIEDLSVDLVAYKAETATGITNAKTAFGAKGDNSTDDTAAIQAAIDAAIQSTGILYLPQGTYRTTGTLYIWGTIRIVGAKGKIYGQPTVINYNGNGVAIHFQKKNSPSGPLIESTNIGGVFLENINIQRNFSGDGSFGTQGVGYNLHYVSEGSFDKVGVTGFKVGHQCQGLTIFEFNKCDILFCQYGTSLRKTSVVGGTELANTHVSYNACNFYMNDEAHVLAGGAKVSFFECHMEQTKATFLFDGSVNNNPMENFVIQACNMRNHTGDMGTEYTDSRILKFVGGVSLTFLLDNIHFFDNFCKLKGDNAVPIEILTNSNSNMTVFIDMENNTFYGAPLGIVVSDSAFQPAIDFGYRRVRKEDGSVYSPAVPDMTNGKKLGWMTASDRNRVSGVIQLGDNTQITENEGALYYDYVGHIPKVRGQNRTQNLLPMTFGTAAPTSGAYTLLDVVFNSSPSRTKNISHWKPTAAGTPGTWRAFGCGNGTTAERTALTMATGDAGYMYFDTDLAKMVMWSGTAWLI
ncbi:hypothetical protein GC096_03870 [Paenibacillus sp. LMG 31461]|uniref:Rhamnogalacturonase A/B/Epimerase-like pectate lyase domain-containing protein n=2 Tax=Paenibacillus plantarum TaxID=2654975 RepID=A0ABX1X447_9BACL|nr:hypothetical protein [Paenibacillus plantarum]